MVSWISQTLESTAAVLMSLSLLKIALDPKKWLYVLKLVKLSAIKANRSILSCYHQVQSVVKAGV